MRRVNPYHGQPRSERTLAGKNAIQTILDNLHFIPTGQLEKLEDKLAAELTRREES